MHFLGKTTKLMSSKVNEVACGFKETKEKLPKGNIIVTGNPNKMALNNLTKEEAKKNTNIDGKLLLIFGGSQGAKKINETVIDIVKNGLFGDYNVIYATGPKNFEEVASQVEKECGVFYKIEKTEDSLNLYKYSDSLNKSITYSKGKDGGLEKVETIDTNIALRKNKIEIKKFIYNMEEVLKAADLVVSRSGALTCTEIAEVGVASILIPFPYAAENHQLFNAKTLENAKAGVIIEEKDLSSKLLMQGIDEILGDDTLRLTMENNAKKLKVGNPIDNIQKEIEKILNIKSL